MEWTHADRLSPMGQKIVQYFKQREALLLTGLRSINNTEEMTAFQRGQLQEGALLLKQLSGDPSSSS
jgi:hypothetical protein